MKTTVKFNKGNEQVTVTNLEVAQRSPGEQFTSYMNAVISYDEFCSKQTKTGQARKNERGNKRRQMFAQFSDVQQEMSAIHNRLINKIKEEKNNQIEKIVVDITIDGRKKGNLPKIIEGVRMAIFVGGISPQYYDLGLINFTIQKQ